MPEWVLPVLSIISPFIAGLFAYAAKAEAKRVEGEVNGRMDVHVAEDEVIHTHVKESLARIERKLDRVIEAKK